MRNDMGHNDDDDDDDELVMKRGLKRATFWTPLRGPLPVEASFDAEGGLGADDDLMARNMKAMRYGRK